MKASPNRKALHIRKPRLARRLLHVQRTRLIQKQRPSPRMHHVPKARLIRRLLRELKFVQTTPLSQKKKLLQKNDDNSSNPASFDAGSQRKLRAALCILE